MIKCECGEHIFLEPKNDRLVCPTCGILFISDEYGNIKSIPADDNTPQFNPVNMGNEYDQASK